MGDMQRARAMTVRARHQHILALLKERPAVSVAELAAELGVSQNTIRNDLDALAEQGLVVRSHGGASIPTALLPPQLWPEGATPSPRWDYVAQYAASRIEDGDSLILGDCPLCVYLAERITQHNLRVITSSLSVAYLLAQEPSNRVVIAGGELDRAHLSTTGNLTEAALRDFRASKSFFSCSGVSVQNGLTEANSESARIKREMRASADLVFVLVESERVGKIDLFPVARLGEVSRIVTDEGLDRSKVQSLVEAGAKLTVCGPEGHETYRSKPSQGKSLHVGFANLSHGIWFAQEVRQSLQEAARQAGRVELLVADNETDPATAEHNAEMLLKEKVDLLIEYEGTGMAARPIMRMARAADVPLIAVDIPITGATYFGSDHDSAGNTAGQVMGKWINAHWGGKADELWLVTCAGGGTELVNGEDHLQHWLDANRRESLAPVVRLDAAYDALVTLVKPVPEPRHMIMPGDWKTSEEAVVRLQEVFAGLLPSVPLTHRVAVIGLTDEVALALAQAVRAVGRASNFAALGFGNDSPGVRAELSLPDTCLLGTVVLHPERYGEELLRSTLRILDGEVVPPAVYVQHSFVSREDVRRGR